MHGTIREDRTSLSTQHGLDIGWSATCDREFTIVVHINIVMSYGSSHIHAMLNTKQKPLFQRVLVDLQHT